MTIEGLASPSNTCFSLCGALSLQSGFKKKERGMESELATLRQGLETAQQVAAEAAQRAGQAQQEAQAALLERCVAMAT
jgi:hypothetical protein